MWRYLPYIVILCFHCTNNLDNSRHSLCVGIKCDDFFYLLMHEAWFYFRLSVERKRWFALYKLFSNWNNIRSKSHEKMTNFLLQHHHFYWELHSSLFFSYLPLCFIFNFGKLNSLGTTTYVSAIIVFCTIVSI